MSQILEPADLIEGGLRRLLSIVVRSHTVPLVAMELTWNEGFVVKIKDVVETAK